MFVSYSYDNFYLQWLRGYIEVCRLANDSNVNQIATITDNRGQNNHGDIVYSSTATSTSVSFLNLNKGFKRKAIMI